MELTIADLDRSGGVSDKGATEAAFALKGSMRQRKRQNKAVGIGTACAVRSKSVGSRGVFAPARRRRSPSASSCRSHRTWRRPGAICPIPATGGWLRSAMSASPPGSIRITATRRRRRILSRRLRNQATRPPSIPARSRRPRATTTSTSSPTCPARRSPSTPTATSLRTGCATIAGTPRTGLSASPIRGRRARPPRSATTGSAAAPPSQARPPAAGARSPHRTSGAARASARRAMPATR